MTSRRIRRVKGSWGRQLSKMWGIPVRAKVTQSEKTANRYRTAIPFGPTPKGETVSIKKGDNRTKTIIYVGPENRKNQAKIIVAHELGHAFHEQKSGPQKISPIAVVSDRRGLEKLQLTEFFARVSEFEYCKRFNRERYFKIIKENLASKGLLGASEGKWVAARFLASFPKSGERNRIMREILSKDFQSIRQVYELLKNKGMKTNKPKFRTRRKQPLKH